MDDIKESQEYKKEYQELKKYYREYYRKEEKQKAKKYRKYKKRISKEKFQAFLEVQRSGLTDMLNIFYVMKLAEYNGVVLTKSDVFYMLKNYRELKECYK